MTVRTALIGYGLGGASFHAPFISTTPDLALTAVVTADPDRQERVRARYPGAAIVASVDELWGRASELDLVVIAAPNRYHADYARRALEHGLHAVVDKPFAGSAADARALVELAAARNRMIVPFHNRRWDGDFRTVRRLADDGALGAIHRFESRFERWRPAPKAGWRESADPLDLGGLLFDLGTHLVDQAIALFGKPTEVYAELRALRAGVDTDDDAFLALTHEGGVRSHLWASALAADLGPRFRVLGDRAAYVKRGMDPQEDALRAGAAPGGPGWGEEPEPAWGIVRSGDGGAPVRTEPGDYGAFYAGVASSIATGAPPPVDPLDAVAGLEVLEAAQLAARSRGVVALR